MEPADFNMGFFSLAGRNAIVTGGNGGLGRAFSTALATAGANVMVAGLFDDDGTTREMVEQRGVAYAFVEADIAAPGECKRVVDACLDRWGRVDILVNCAGIGINVQDVTRFGRAQWDRMVSVNLTAAFEMIHEVCPHMIAQKSGKIINIASLLSFQGGIRVASYTASKSGLAGLTKLLANEWAGKGINVNAIAPGYVATNNTEALRNDPERYKAILDRIPAGRWAQPSDIAGAAVFLASPAADYVHGITLPVDGGWLAR